jgi:hypothetical protein
MWYVIAMPSVMDIILGNNVARSGPYDLKTAIIHMDTLRRWGRKCYAIRIAH